MGPTILPHGTAALVLRYALLRHTLKLLKAYSQSYCVKTTFLLVLQASLGFIIGRQRGQAFIGINTAKSLWKWHRASGVSTHSLH